MAFASVSARRPLSEINTTPLIDVMLVLLVMIIFTIPMATHSLELPLPQDGRVTAPDPVKNKVVLTSDGAVLWNGDAVTQGELATLLHQTLQFPTEPELQFEPEATASYDQAARVLNVIEASGVSRFGFVGNERYRVFSRAD